MSRRPGSARRRAFPQAPIALTALLGLAAAGASAAPEPFAPCEERFARAPDAWESSRCFYEVAQSGGAWAEGARRLEALAGRRPGRPWPLLARAYLEETLRADRATALYRGAIEAFAAVRFAEGEVRARCALAAWLASRGERDGAGAELAAAVRSAEAAGEAGPLAEALVFRARHLQTFGEELQEAQRLALRAEGLLFPEGDPVRQMLGLEVLAKLERDLGRPDRAEVHFRKLRDLARERGRAGLAARAELGLGALRLDELDRAPRAAGREKTVEQLRAALAAAEAVGDPGIEAGTRAFLGHLLVGAEGRGNLERCLSLARGRYAPFAASCLLSLARLVGDGAAAERALDEARLLAEASGDPGLLARYRYGRMNLSWRTAPRARAEADTWAALQAVEALRDLQIEQRGRAGLFSRWLAPYYAASGHFFEAFERSGDPADLDRGLAVAEWMRARVLRDLLGVPGRTGPAEPPRLRREIERSLAPDEALVAFQIAPREDLYGFAGGSWLIAASRRGTRAYRLPETVGRAPLETAVSAFLGLVAKRDGSEDEIAAALGSQLLGPALAGLSAEVRRLAIVPDGALHLLPFADLRIAALPTGTARIAERYEVSLASSATLWLRFRASSPVRPRAALILADPSLFPPGAPAASSRDGRGEGRRAPLPGARSEGRRVLRRVGGGSVLRIGPEAGEGFLKKSDLSRYALLHFATHAEADESEPESSAVLLAADRAGEDGRLQVDEIARLRLPGTLIALSSCRGAAGALVGGEGLMSLSRAFLAAGAAVVLGSLWPVRDDDAEDFFAAFYDRLAAGETAASAFGAAQRERIKAGAPAEAWAGFVLAGNGGWRLPSSPQAGAAAARPRGLVGGALAALAFLTAIAALALGCRYRLSTRSRSSRTGR